MSEKRRLLEGGQIQRVPGTDPNVFQFQDAAGVPIPPEQLFRGTYSQMLELILAPSITYTQLGALARTGRLAREWIEAKQLWRKLFARDFPTTYAYATGQLTKIFMVAAIKHRLDRITAPERRKNELTYWKRYYELFNRVSIFLPMHIRGYSIAWSHVLNNAKSVVQPSSYDTLNYRDGDTGMYIAYRPTVADEIANRTILYAMSPHVRSPQPVERFYFDRRSETSVAVRVEHIDRETFTFGAPIALENGGYSIWQSTDGFSLILWLAYEAKVHVMQIASITNALELVSSACLSCDATDTQLYQCGACAVDSVGYCGRECQSEHWPKHQHTCVASGAKK